MKVPEFLPLKVDQLPFRWGRVVQSVHLAQETRGLGFDTGPATYFDFSWRWLSVTGESMCS